MSPLVIVLSAAWLVFLAWIAWGYFAVRGVEQPPFTVLERADGYEVREYPAYIAAQVSVKKGWSDALNTGFEILADFIFGNNVTQESIAMTRPVGIEAEPENELIATSVPVLTQERGDAFLVSFIMPSKYTSETLPRPNNPEIRIVEVPESVVAVRSVSGRMDHDRALREEAALRELLRRDKRVTLSTARVAQYNPPWTPPFLRLNEVLIPVRREAYQ